MQNLVIFLLFGTLFAIGESIIIRDDSSDSHESSYYSGGGHRPKPPSPTKPSSKCESGWTRVQRLSGGWCVKVFAGLTNQPQAESICAQNGARLSAVESSQERETIAELGRVLMTTSSTWKFGSLRTGIKRNTLNSPFYVTDGNAKDLNAVKWSHAEPNQGSYNGGGNNCGMMWLWVPGGRQVQQRVHGEFFSMVCHITWNDRFRGFVCGKSAV
ncbi:hypothetical protein GCK72_010012 [Caenorhabditis remanei]|uniref:C-type lectin domain-containing protein n=1 Tax=Caenorhabditis remanei TaxID=31234 RepID=A0A6A5H4H1_CAERE|nr:hypothetical protein GCK72_010012 [Caenorhabditis remanei]KAF1761756.1 hypothetical protein GCK72_010012 [Caenorhabditis remanei]